MRNVTRAKYSIYKRKDNTKYENQIAFIYKLLGNRQIPLITVI
jgi:hypothetical protein